MSRFRFVPPSLCFVLALVLASCADAPGPSPRTRTSTARESAFASEQERPGLGTRWGETRTSRSVATSFRRANERRPFATTAIYYNDLPGVLAMAGSISPRREWPRLSGPAANLLSAGLRDQSGRFLPGLLAGDRWFVVGEEGRRYSIALQNRSELRLEVVLSVDGLDVIDGQAASFGKHGYVIPPHGWLNVQGFRQSSEAVAAFRFGSVRESYANQKYGETRNVGVIGIALFNERGTNPFDDTEVRRRLDANPFPGRFATPP